MEEHIRREIRGYNLVCAKVRVFRQNWGLMWSEHNFLEKSASFVVPLIPLCFFCTTVRPVDRYLYSRAHQLFYNMAADTGRGSGITGAILTKTILFQIAKNKLRKKAQKAFSATSVCPYAVGLSCFTLSLPHFREIIISDHRKYIFCRLFCWMCRISILFASFSVQYHLICTSLRLELVPRA